METIRNYLESMFASLPNTPEVLQAKYELGQMMEDKYTELIHEGKAENEAVGIVISEFGNLEEIAEALGIERVLKESDTDSPRTISMEEAREYISAKSRMGFLIGLGVLLCICSPVGCIITAGFSEKAMAAGVALLFICIAAGIGLFIYSSIHMSRWNMIRKRQCRIDYGTASFIREQMEGFRTTRALMIAAGVILCIVSVVPVTVAGVLGYDTDYVMGFASSLIFVMIGIGVMLIITSSLRNQAYMELMYLNAAGTVGGTYRQNINSDTVFYENKTIAAIMSVYWPTITCIYLIWSFLTFRWGFTWIIWPIAGIIEMVIKRTLGTSEAGRYL